MVSLFCKLLKCLSGAVCNDTVNWERCSSKDGTVLSNGAKNDANFFMFPISFLNPKGGKGGSSPLRDFGCFQKIKTGDGDGGGEEGEESRCFVFLVFDSSVFFRGG